MLRASSQLPSYLGKGCRPHGAAIQWVQANVVLAKARGYAESKSSIGNSKPIVLPGSASAATNEPLPIGPVATSASSSLLKTSSSPVTPTSHSAIPPSNIPLTPPPPPTASAQATPPSKVGSPPIAPRPVSKTPSPMPETPAKKPRRFFRRFLITLVSLSILGFGGGVYYSQVNDNFHDFFTEYIPFGEEAVLYLEEREFRRRYPSISPKPKPRDTGNKVTIPSKSGVSWKYAEEDKTSSALGQNKLKPGEAQQQPTETRPAEQVKAVEKAKKDAASSPSPKPITSGDLDSTKQPAASTHPASETALKPAPTPASKPSQPVKKAELVQTSAPTKLSTAARPPEVDEPSRFPSEVTRIDPININAANEPVVQDLVKIFNDIILVVNSDNSNDKFSATIGKAKSELAKVGPKIKDLKEAASKEADAKVKSSHEDFDRAAKELVRRLEGEMHDQEAVWKDEYEKERKKLQEVYDQKLKSEAERAHEIYEQRVRNELLEQAVEMKRKFASDIKTRVEEERNGRLGKLKDLSETINDLEKLTTGWSGVVDSNLRTQQLHVAVEAVRANLESAAVPRPFIRELAALKEISSDDPVVNAAIASIHPISYQRGIPSSAQLIDRFRRVAVEVRKASLLPDEAGVASHASSLVLSKLLFKKKGIAAGDDVESILTRTETLLEEGNLDGAAREMNGLQGWAKTLSVDWLGEVRKVLEVQQALDVIAAEARLQSLRVE